MTSVNAQLHIESVATEYQSCMTLQSVLNSHQLGGRLLPSSALLRHVQISKGGGGACVRWHLLAAARADHGMPTLNCRRGSAAEWAETKTRALDCLTCQGTRAGNRAFKTFNPARAPRLRSHGGRVAAHLTFPLTSSKLLRAISIASLQKNDNLSGPGPARAWPSWVRQHDAVPAPICTSPARQANTLSPAGYKPNGQGDSCWPYA